MIRWGTDVKQQISLEIKEALSSSRLDIVILSNDYKKSIYCLNEAGIIRYKNDSYKLIVSSPGIFDEPTAGFISTDFRLCRLEDDNFCGSFFGLLIDRGAFVSDLQEQFRLDVDVSEKIRPHE